MLQLPGIQHISRPLILAPMEGVTDTVFRRICLELGADAAISEFIAAEAVRRGVIKSMRKMEAAKGETLRWVQLFGSQPEAMAEAAVVSEAGGATVIDLNFGCPVKKIVSKGAGAALLQEPEKMKRIADAVVKAVSIPVTAKTRLGWAAGSFIASDVAIMLQDAGISAITIHGRTRAQQYGGHADWNKIAMVKSTPGLVIPVIGNGDIDSVDKAQQAFQLYGVDAVMIGRAAMGNPWLFDKIRSSFNGHEPIQPTIKDKTLLCARHLQESLQLKDEKRAVIEMRKHFPLYFRGLAGFKPFKLRLQGAVSIAEALDILNEISLHYDGASVDSAF